MTTLVSWVSVDNRGSSAIYIASDSRITWANSSQNWDSGRKVFASLSPDIFGYSGEVLFPSLTLGQLSDLIDRKVLWSDNSTAEARHATILDYLKTSFSRRRNAPDGDFTIIHCSRDADGLKSHFHLWRIDYHARAKSWQSRSISTSNQGNSRLLVSLGSGEQALRTHVASWDKSPQGGTARAIFSAFCDALETGADPRTGGAPQLVSLNRRGGGKVIGFVADGDRYVYGLPVRPETNLTHIEWVDKLFQRISPNSGALLSGAQRHARVEQRSMDGFKELVRRTSKS